MRLKRRMFLGQAGSLLLTSAGLSACCGTRGRSGPPADEAVRGAATLASTADEVAFLHGVASGDPGLDRVILWTRVQPLTSKLPPAITVRCWVSVDSAGRRRILEGHVQALASRDYTVHVDAQGLRPGKRYYYGFDAAGVSSPIGRTRTLPEQTEHVRLAVGSCSNYAQGYFNGYARIAEWDGLDAVVHLGDYIYEGDPRPKKATDVPVRMPEPQRGLRSLSDYRQRYAHYRTDPDLQAAHQNHPWIVVWDDHEIANNIYRTGAQVHRPKFTETKARLEAAVQAYFEWMPIRRPNLAEPLRIYRQFRFGSLCDLLMLDGRVIGRDPQQVATAPQLADPSRSMLGSAQEQWLSDSLADSQRRGIRWRLLGQQTLMGQLVLDGRASILDRWDGYPAARQRLFETLQRRSIDNVVVLTGDIHSSWGLDLAPNPFEAASYDSATGQGAVAVEAVCPGLTSPGPFRRGRSRALTDHIRKTHPHVRYLEGKRRGYVVLDIRQERVRCEWHLLPTVEERSTAQVLDQALEVRSGAAHWLPAMG